MRSGIIFVLLLVINVASAQNFNWITPNKTYLKLYITSDGIYRINKSDFVNAGINPSNIDPRTIKVLYKGNQIPIYFFGENDGIFNDNDYLDFYGQRNYGGQTITYKDNGLTNVPDYITNEYYNLYSDTSIYWIDWNGSFGLRFQEYNFNNNIFYPSNYFYTSKHFEYDRLYSQGEKINNSDYRNANNEKISGEGWYWALLQRNNTISDTFRTVNLSDNPQVCFLKLFAYPNSYSEQIFNEHRLILKINGNALDTLITDNYRRIDTTIGFSSSLLSSSGINTISVTYTGTSGYQGYMYFDFLEISYPRNFAMENSSLSMSIRQNDTSSARFKISNASVSNEINIYDIHNNQRISNYIFSSDTLIFSGKQNGSFEIINNYNTNKPVNIKQRQVPDLVKNINGTDYLIIYNKLFESSAEQLRQFRTTNNNFRTFKAEVEDIYDVYNYGMENPIAVRYFAANVYNNWQAPKIKFILLFGRGSLDPKNHLKSTYWQNFVPVYGYPSTDGYFANFNFNSITYFQQAAIGRLPVYTQQEATDVVNKIIQYETQKSNPEIWWKNFIYITGGQTISEQIQFANQSNQFISSYIQPPPTGGTFVKIYRNDSTGYVTFNYQDSIKKAINRGGLITNYIGHAGSNIWDNGIDGPGVLSNQNHLGLILSMTCFTGKTAENFRSFGENFITIANKGAIGFIGSTYWSFSSTGNLYNDYLLSSYSQDTIRQIGLLIRNASQRMSSDSNSYTARNTINCYGLLGDPAVTLLSPKYPEYAISDADYKMSNPFPSVKEQITLSIFPQNAGIHSDSTKIRFTLTKNNLQYSAKDTIIYNFNTVDTVKYNFIIDSAGSYSVKVLLDAENWNIKEIKTNNSIIIPINLKNISFVPLKPVNNQVVGDTVEITGINPNINLIKNNVKLFLQIDTSSNFNSSIQQIYYNASPQGMVTKFKYAVPVKDSNIVYFFRLNAVINNIDTSGWSSTQRFVYNPGLLVSDKTTLYKRNISQYDNIELINAEGSRDSITIRRYVGNIFAQGWGNNSFNLSYVNINNKEYNFVEPQFLGGLNLMKLNKYNSHLLEIKHFTFTTNQANDSVINYLNTFNENHILIILKSAPENTNFNMNSSLKSKIKFFGSNLVDSVNLTSYNSTWSFISYSTQPSPVSSESFKSNSSAAISTMQPLFYYDSAYVTNTFSAPEQWKSALWNIIQPPFTNIFTDIYGIKKSQEQVKLFNDISGSAQLNLDTINPYNFSSLKFISKLSLDTINGTQSPVFKNFLLRYIPSAELIADNNSVIKKDTILQEGDSLAIKLNIGNYGYTDISKIINKWTASSPSGIKLLKLDTLNALLKVDSVLTLNFLLPTAGLRNSQKLFDTINIFYEGILADKNEFFYYNNISYTGIILTGDTSKPVFEITYDGVKSISGDYVSANPKIIAKFFDDSKIFINDTSNVRVKLDTTNIWYYINGVKNPDIDIQFSSNKYLQAIIDFRPKNLSEGEHIFYYYAIDHNGNYADTVEHYLYVTSDFKVIGFENYPNPMKNYTHFLINIAGTTPPQNAKLKLYTVAGRMIKTIDLLLNIGYNEIFWDGRDEDGDYPANGVYFYKLIAEYNGKKETKIQKLVILK